MAQTPLLGQGAGIPGQWTETLTAADVELLAGHEPALLTTDEIAGDSLALAALTVVGLSGGKLVPAVYAADYGVGGVRPIGVLVAPVTTGVSNTKGAPVYRGGCLNVDALVWPASFDTDAKKFKAFEGAPSPTRIVLRRPKTATV